LPGGCKIKKGVGRRKTRHHAGITKNRNPDKGGGKKKKTSGKAYGRTDPVLKGEIGQNIKWGHRAVSLRLVRFSTDSGL